MSFEPRILALLCHWCSYAAADRAGEAHCKHAPNALPVRVMCSSRIDPTLVIRAFSAGFDGVLVAGCRAGDCHYIDGNSKAHARFHLLRQMLAGQGLDSGRLRFEWVSASEGARYARIIDEMTEALRALGPLGWSSRAAEDAEQSLEVLGKGELP